MSMSRKDYEQIARIVGESLGEVQADWASNPAVDAAISDLQEILVGRLSFYFKGDNDRFGVETFSAAVEVAAEAAYQATEQAQQEVVR